MYENGKQTYRYYRKRKHKNRMKDHHAKTYHYGVYSNMKYPEFCASLTDEELGYSFGPVKHIPSALQYWRQYYLTGPRQYAKWCTSRAIRAYWRDEINNYLNYDPDEWEDIETDLAQHSEYQKYYDYNNTIW